MPHMHPCTSSPNILHQQPLHSVYLTAWCGFTGEFFLRHFFVEILTQVPKTCSLSTPRYSEFFQQQVISAVQERQCLQTPISMQDGAPTQNVPQVKTLLSADFGDNRVISKHFQNAWLSRLPDLNPCDFWLWGF
ncbi:uncharacterized protein TNCV_3948531 [Trichonephila clavipes]|nr:uncharacterized protein TNCV_3948531 [Trichonephila clavipes]